ncbi:unnamed protein product, partial [Ranitomeya imitator]
SFSLSFPQFSFIMHWAVLFLLTVYLTSSSAQFTVIQDGPISVSPGGSVRLTCSLSTGNVGGGNLPNWIYQILGSVPKLVIGSSSTTNQNYRPSWTSDRFTGSITGGSAVLSISKVEVGDTGDYYCVVWSGTQCTVVQKVQNTDTYTSSLLYNPKDITA